MKVLNSKRHAGQRLDIWWFTLSNPEKWIDKEDEVNLVLHDSANADTLGTVRIRLDETGWRSRIVNAHGYSNRKGHFVSAYVTNRLGQGFYVNFGRKRDGFYLVKPEKPSPQEF